MNGAILTLGGYRTILKNILKVKQGILKGESSLYH
jgi:hypothetical protein